MLVGCGGGDCAQTPLACVAVFMKLVLEVFFYHQLAHILYLHLWCIMYQVSSIR